LQEDRNLTSKEFLKYQEKLADAAEKVSLLKVLLE